MSEPFNPYYHLLGIPLSEQPADHYRLLGVRPLEYDPAVIQRASDERTAHLRQFQSTAYAAAAEALLREVAAASGCLLNRQQKAAYDRALRERLAGGAVAAPRMAAASAPQPQPAQPQPAQPMPVQPRPIPAALPTASAAATTPNVGSAPSVGTAAASKPAGRKRFDPLLIGAGALAVVAVVVGIVLLGWPGRNDDSPKANPEQAASSSNTAEESDHLAVNPPGHQDADGPDETSAVEQPQPSAATPDTSETLPSAPTDEPVEVSPPGNHPPTIDGAPAPPATPAEPPAAAEPPRSAKTLLRQGDVEVEIVSAAVEVVETLGSLSSHTLALSSSDEKCLVLKIQIRNTGNSRTVNYVRWGGATLFDVPVGLTDDVDMLYRQVSTVTPPGQAEVDAEASVATLTEQNFRAVSRLKEPVVVFFWAPWSESCRNLLPSIDHLSAEYGDAIRVARFQVPDGTSPNTFAATPFIVRMEVTTIPYAIIFHRGKVVKRFVGHFALGELEEGVDALLPEKLPPHETIGPGASFSETLVFERPSENAAYLKLELPAAAFGGTGPLKFEIPQRLIRGNTP